ncbi:hypothetical protein PS723_02105 [Pseudomonas fluorescens]|uniref:Uncharacterized protein n=1 Tax=Pseudomonas fluorescens TaxID=294 RepID=A0A5E7CES8_PSEFL|nr:hypothetical protein PS723_02105 [Pseudomonas fluorescens]
MALRIMQKMKEPIELAGRRMVMTTSIGISVFPDDGKTCEELLKNADLALYQSKGNGRNGLHFFSPNLKTKATLELQLEEELRNALRGESGLMLYYQPILDLKSGQVTKLEALVRWQHPTHGLLVPDRFIGIAEANGLIAELDHWVLRKACEDLSTLSRQGCSTLKIAVNCSALNLAREELPDEIESVEQYDFLKLFGSDFVQGYLLSPPVPLDELHPVLNEINQRRQPTPMAISFLGIAHGTDGPMSRDLFLDNPGRYAGASIEQPVR